MHDSEPSECLFHLPWRRGTVYSLWCGRQRYDTDRYDDSAGRAAAEASAGELYIEVESMRLLLVLSH